MNGHGYGFTVDEDATGKAYDSHLARRLYRYLRPYLAYIVLGTVCLLGSSASQLAGPYLVGVGIDKYIIPGRLEGFSTLLVLYMAVNTADFALRFAQIYITNYLGQRTMFDLRMSLFRHLQSLSLRFFDRNPVGRLVTRATSDVEVLNELFSTGLVTVIGDLAMIVGIMGAMLWLDWKLALLTFSILPVLLAVTFYFRKKLREAFRLVRLRIARINAFLQETLSGMSVIQLFNRQQRAREQFDALNLDHMDAHLKTVRNYAIFYPVMELIGTVSLAIILWYGGLSVMKGTLTFGVLVMFIQYVAKFFQPISDLSEKYNIFQAAAASSERIFNLLDKQERIPDPAEPVWCDRIDGAVQFRDVHFAYNEGDPVLRGISFEAEAGEKIAVVGSTGAGKTTLINLLSRFYDPQQGEIRIDGTDIRNFEKKWLRRNIGIALQDVFIFSGTIRSNIALGEENPALEKIIEAAETIGASEFIEKLPGGYDHELTERGSTLSVGQRQLLSFARVMYKNPRILVLDEATSSVDTHTEFLIQKALEKLIAGRTSLVIAHRLSTIRHVDRIIVMHHGKLVETGSHEELLQQKGIYFNLYQLQYKDQEAALPEA
ncbi:MAG: antibiotic ABC transporter ATP-binding protein [Candidatus Glassbacteria bacterium GWA2_58_10]|uniref:Antibiotic ABC transporter ATP-binding protein n=1 Tax=Candidatus Glassbacteria bacterium GWA2_58_10 TaxID=1817865 RepID=A0A1F5YG14_9BACT|nr:MAG: antibiotic ABC transporter ATP-binding protein [Candidatus Glassbacteria bacterium GWA2_58_10]